MSKNIIDIELNSVHMGAMQPGGNCKVCGQSLPDFQTIQGFTIKPSLCDNCGDKMAKDEYDEKMKEVIENKLKTTRIPRRYTEWDNETGVEKGSIDLVKWLRPRFRGSVYISGPHGKGKTHTVAYSAFSIMQKQNIGVLFINSQEWLSEMMMQKMMGESIVKHIKHACECDLVIIDDMGKEKLTESKLELIYNVINKRDVDEMRTYFTSNYTIEELAARFDTNYGPAIVERIRRMVGDNIYTI